MIKANIGKITWQLLASQISNSKLSQKHTCVGSQLDWIKSQMVQAHKKTKLLTLTPTLIKVLIKSTQTELIPKTIEPWLFRRPEQLHTRLKRLVVPLKLSQERFHHRVDSLSTQRWPIREQEHQRLQPQVQEPSRQKVKPIKTSELHTQTVGFHRRITRRTEIRSQRPHPVKVLLSLLRRRKIVQLDTMSSVSEYSGELRCWQRSELRKKLQTAESVDCSLPCRAQNYVCYRPEVSRDEPQMEDE